MKGTRERRWAAAGAALSAMIAGLVLLRLGGVHLVEPPAPAVATGAGAGFVAAARRSLPIRAASAAVPSAAPTPARALAVNPPPLLAAGGPTLDLADLRRRLPENLFWELGEPTDDASVLREREEQERRWDETYGRIQSGTASEEEIAAYYDFRRRLSEDYRALSLQVLDDPGDRLSERDRGLHEMNVRMHTQRLEELPQKQDRALARKRQQDALREAWERAGRPQ
jgi:hypothetical protein